MFHFVVVWKMPFFLFSPRSLFFLVQASIDLFLVTLLILLHGQENEFAKCPVADSSAVADLSAVALHLRPECASQAKSSTRVCFSGKTCTSSGFLRDSLGD